MKWRFQTSCCVVSALIAGGCATGRMADLKDCATASVGIGIGLDATVKAGCLVHPSIGVVGSATQRLGIEDRTLPPVWREIQLVWPAMAIFANGTARSYGRPEAPLISFMRMDVSRDHKMTRSFGTSWIPALNRKSEVDPFSFHEATDIEVGATLLLVSARVGINPLEILDFMLGFLGVDLAGDDPPSAAATAQQLETAPSVADTTGAASDENQ